MKLSLSRKIGLVVLSVLTVFMTAMVVTLLHYNKAHTMAEAEKQVQMSTDLIVRSLNFSMAQGVSDVDPLIQRISNSGEGLQARLTPTNLIRAGAEAGLNETERKVLISRQPFQAREKQNGEPVIRGVVPILAEASCIECHEAKVGETLAVVSIGHSIADVYAANVSYQRLAIILALATLLIIALTINWLIRRQVITPLQQCVALTKQLTLGDLSNSLNLKSKDEIGELAQALGTMTEALQAKAQAAADDAAV